MSNQKCQLKTAQRGELERRVEKGALERGFRITDQRESWADLGYEWVREERGELEKEELG